MTRDDEVRWAAAELESAAHHAGGWLTEALWHADDADAEVTMTDAQRRSAQANVDAIAGAMARWKAIGGDATTHRIWVNPESTILVTLWASGVVTVAFREEPDALWGPPVRLREEKT